MLFSSVIFIYLFLPCVLLVYYGLLRKNRNAQNIFLFLASLFFYAWGEPKFVLVMLLSIVCNWAFGLLVHSARQNGSLKKARIILSLGCILNLSLLFVFKYLNFTLSNINSLFGTSFVSDIALPIGISFFTFQAMSYVIDVYRAKGQIQKNILNVGLYIAFFPQLIAGPIVRYETVADQIQNRKETSEDFFSGFARFVAGLGKKVLLANTFAALADDIFALCVDKGVASLTAWLGAIAYSLQIFFDFSGYSDMAIGLGKMFGFHFLENFNYPYISASITEFWRRWHISLGTWFRDYVYFPLGGSRVKSKLRLIFNLLAVWLLTGIWHGANWTFVVWGLMYFVLLSLEKLFGLSQKGGILKSILSRCYTLFFVIIGWVIFRADSLLHALLYIKSMFTFGADGVFLAYFSGSAVPVALGIILSTPLLKCISVRLGCNSFFAVIRAMALVAVFVLSIASLVSSSYNPFIYFNF